MTKTKNYNLNQWDAHDPIRRGDFNADNAAIDAALKAVSDRAETDCAAAQSAGDRGLAALRGALGDLCRLAYQADGQGTFTGWRRGFDFDRLDDGSTAALSGALVRQAGKARLAVDGWSGGTLEWSPEVVALPSGGTAQALSEAWSPDGRGKVTSLTLTVKPGSVTNTRTIKVHAVLMRGEEELAVTDIQKSSFSTGELTYTFTTQVTVEPQEVYRLKLVLDNTANAVALNVSLMDGVTVTATPVRCTVGTITPAVFALTGREIQAWAQYSTLGTVTMQMLLNSVWTDMEPEDEEASVTPEGEACTEGRFWLELPEAIDGVQLRISVSCNNECSVYGYGAVAL